MSYKPRYCKAKLVWPLDIDRKHICGPKPHQENWTDEAVIKRDIHHGYLKHRAQAKFRGEEHSLTREEWEAMWTEELWLKRGRSADSVCLMMKNPALGWHKNNVIIGTRKEYLARNKEYRELKNAK